MTKVDPDFPKKVHPGDLIIAEYMGFGHDHDHACLSILGAGVVAVICEGVSAVLSAKFHRAWLTSGGTSGDFARCKAG
jgi:3-isopropylmalate dehydratase small subunit